MPSDSNGVYSLPPQYFVQNGDTVLPAQHNPPLEDIAQALTNRIMKDGRTVWTGDMKAGGFRITGMGPGQSDSDAATVGQIGRKATFATVAALRADTTLSYTTGPSRVTEADYIFVVVGGFEYTVAASDATDFHVETAGGVKLYVLPDRDGYHHTLAWGAAGDDINLSGTDDAAIIQKIADYTPFIHFDAQHYSGAIIQLQSGSRLRGGLTPSFTNAGANGTSISWVRSTRAAIGDGNPIFRVGAVGSQPQGFVAERLGFFGDLAVDPVNLAATLDQGIYGIDVSGLKNGGHFIDCWFRQLRKGVFADGDPYTDQIVFRGCFWSRNYQMVDMQPDGGTAGLVFIGCMAYENVTLISTAYNAEFFGTTIQNSSPSSIETAIVAKNITWMGGWIEGLIVPFQPTNSAHVTGLWAGEGTAIGGSGSRFLFKFDDNVSVTYESSRIPTNTRFGTFLAVASLGTVAVEINGAFDGTNFGDLASINSYLGQINYKGSGNTNSEDWNFEGRRFRTITGTATISRADIGGLVRAAISSNPTLTVPANSVTPVPVGAWVTVVNLSGSFNITISSTDAIIHNLGTGSRLLGPRGLAHLVKVGATEWTLYGQGIT